MSDTQDGSLPLDKTGETIVCVVVQFNELQSIQVLLFWFILLASAIQKSLVLH